MISIQHVGKILSTQGQNVRYSPGHKGVRSIHIKETMPVIWATQVLETLAKRGVPSRAEITDAAMGERAECVMLNKGPYILQAVQVFDNILHRMESTRTRNDRC